MKGWLSRQARKWYSYWDLNAATRNLANMDFRESNGEICPRREWTEGEAWLARAEEEYKAARS